MILRSICVRFEKYYLTHVLMLPHLRPKFFFDSSAFLIFLKDINKRTYHMGKDMKYTCPCGIHLPNKLCNTKKIKPRV